MSAVQEAKDNTKNEGAVKAGNGKYIFELTKMAGMDAGIGYSTAFGPVIEGERMQCGLIRTVGSGTCCGRVTPSVPRERPAPSHHSEAARCASTD